MTNSGFTLVELLVVIAIMGLLGTASVGGYRAMQRGIEERGAVQNVNQFIRSAYQRAQIDRQPVAVYFWNELLRKESEDVTPIVVGKAVAVRRSGRISGKTGSGTGMKLYDEFGDLRFMRLTKDGDDEEDDDESPDSGSTKAGNGMFLYHMEGSETGFRRSVVSQTTKRGSSRERLLMSGGRSVEIDSYAFVVMDDGGVQWNYGDAYGFEFAEIQLPHNYIFGENYSDSDSKPVTEVDVLRFKVGGNSGNGTTGGISGNATVQISSLRPDASGELKPQKVAVSSNPEGRLSR